MAAMPAYGDVIVVLPETNIDARDVLTMTPDLSSLRIVPYCNSSAMVFGTLHDQRTGVLSEFCTRGLLARVVNTAKEKIGIGFTVGVEIEFCLVKKYVVGGPGRSYNESKSVPVPAPVPAPVDKSLFASTTSLNDQDDFIEEVYDNLAKQNISVEMIHSESAPGQLEVVLPYETDVMKLADNVVLAKETIQVCAQKHNMDALFDPKLWDDKAGNGMHLHLSLRDEMTDDPSRNIFPNDHNNSAGFPSSSGMSSIAESFLEGILSHLKSLVSLTLPTVDSYDRIGPGCWTGHRVEWSIEDKESPLRD